MAVYVAASNGCVALISSGVSGNESAFYDASESGDDVFFTTTGKLVGADFDKGYDLYDAHVCSASVPCSPQVVTPPPCSSGDSCKPPPSSQPPLFSAPPSATFKGNGDLVTEPAPSAVEPKGASQSAKLTRALRACKKLRNARRSASCQRSARRRYAARKSRRVGKRGGSHR